MGRSPVRVSQLNQYIDRILGTDPILADVSVIGEISNLNENRNGHIYFSLKDEGSSIRCFLGSWNRGVVEGPLEEGMEVIASGPVSVYTPGGYYSLQVKAVEQGGMGQLAILFEKLKRKLEKEGLFSPEHKQDLPFFPNKIAVVTSPTGAAIEDIKSIITGKNDCVDLLIYPVMVQGIKAPDSISAALDDINENYTDVDLIILGRGGGSAEDLQAFNEEMVARSIFASRIPVISAVGHETDFTIADFVADVRAETPTAAASMAVPDTYELRETIRSCRDGMMEDMQRRLRSMEEKLDSLDPSAFASGLRTRMAYEEKNLLDRLKQMKADILLMIAGLQNHTDHLREILETANPFALMEKGYSMVRTDQGRIVRSLQDIRPGDRVSIYTAGGQADAEILAVREENQS